VGGGGKGKMRKKRRTNFVLKVLDKNCLRDLSCIIGHNVQKVIWTNFVLHALDITF